MGPIIHYTHAKKLERSLEPFLKKGQKSQKKLFWTDHVIPYNRGLSIFQKNHLAQMMNLIVFYTRAKN